jgi:hypothetical protein
MSRGSESTNVTIQFTDIPDLIKKIDEAIYETDYMKVYVTVDTMDFTADEIQELNDNDIF